jgi:hypothetical protein
MSIESSVVRLPVWTLAIRTVCHTADIFLRGFAVATGLGRDRRTRPHRRLQATLESRRKLCGDYCIVTVTPLD